MGASFYIGAETRAEHEALESEGAPEVHVTYGTAGLILEAIGVEFDYCGEIAVADLPAAAEAARRDAWKADLDYGAGPSRRLRKWRKPLTASGGLWSGPNRIGFGAGFGRGNRNRTNRFLGEASRKRFTAYALASRRAPWRE